MTSSPGSVSFDAEAVLADARALAALRRWASRLRAVGYANAVDPVAPGPTRLALGHPVPRATLAGWLTDADLAALVRGGAVDLVDADATVSPRLAFFALGRLLAAVPCDPGDAPERVYVGRDSLWLAEVAAAHAPPGDSAADLGAGTGLLSAILATRYRPVVATGLLPRTVASAVLTPTLNRSADRAPAVFGVVTDVAHGLHPGSFDLVTANPPWVPDQPAGGRGRTYNDGGPSGFELPRRFLHEGAALLRPGGVMVVLGADIVWSDGRAPLRDALAALEGDGYRARVIPTPDGIAWDGISAAFTSPSAGAPECARHVAVVVQRA